MNKTEFRNIEQKLRLCQRRLIAYANSQNGINARKDDDRREIVNLFDAWISWSQTFDDTRRWDYILTKANQYHRELNQLYK